MAHVWSIYTELKNVHKPSLRMKVTVFRVNDCYVMLYDRTCATLQSAFEFATTTKFTLRKEIFMAANASSEVITLI